MSSLTKPSNLKFQFTRRAKRSIVNMQGLKSQRPENRCNKYLFFPKGFRDSRGLGIKVKNTAMCLFFLSLTRQQLPNKDLFAELIMESTGSTAACCQGLTSYYICQRKSCARNCFI